MTDVPNFIKDVPNFVKNIPMLPKSVMRWGTTLNNFPRVSKVKKWTMEMEISVPLAQGLDVSNFLKDVPRVPKFVSKWGTISNHFPKIPKGMNGPWVIR